VYIQKRLVDFVTLTNWVLLLGASLGGLLIASPKFALGIIFGGLIVTINFHLLARTLKGALTPPYLSSHHIILAKYYVRFIISGIIIFFLIKYSMVHPLGLLVGLSVVVASLLLATLLALKILIFKEAV
jgi:hypothetical protein